MTEPSRIYSEVHDIDYRATKEFWDHRASLAGKVNDLSVTMFQDNSQELGRARDVYEKSIVMPQLSINQTTRVLDIGCGTARWGLEMIGKTSHYLGVDFSEELVRVGDENLRKHNAPENFKMQALSATEISTNNLIVQPPFDVFIIAGLFIYLNDQDVSVVLDKVTELAAEYAAVYMREPVATETRLTLDNFFSSDFQRDYSAVYRDESFYNSAISNTLEAAGFKVEVSEPLYPTELSNRKETAQHYWIIRR